MRKFKNLGTVFFIIILTLAFDSITHAQQLKLSLEEIAQKADLIFVGTVENQTARVNKEQTMIFTDVLLKDIRVVYGTKKSIQKGSSEILLTYAGGQFGNIAIEVSHAPVLLRGHRYLLFMMDDGLTYASPLVGGNQGLFEVLTDDVTKEEYLQTSGGKVVVGVDDGGVRLSKSRASGVKAGRLIAAQAQNNPPDGLFNVAATAVDPGAATIVSDPNLEPEGQSSPLALKNFLDFIIRKSLKKPILNERLKKNDKGVFYKRNGDKMEAEPLKLQAREPVKLSFDENNPSPSSFSLSNGAEGIGNIQVQGGTIGACGYHTLPLVMEQVPASDTVTHSVVNDNLFTWNLFMDIFRVQTSDGFFGSNSTNEFGGYVDGETLNRIYGFQWGTALAVMLSRTASTTQCSRFVETDVFWNPSISWTDDAEFAIGNENVVQLRPTNQHETGHVWGLQTGIYPESYDYDIATVMQGYNPFVVEDGRGIHSIDAYYIRRQYQDQTIIPGTTDVGVESYYASNGLKNSTTDAYTYAPGQSINLYNVTVENMSYQPVSELRLRFYLSTNRTISTSDYQMGSYWFWSSFPGESYSVGPYATTIPANIPPGQYYVGALVTINGFASDDYTFNNATSFYNPITIGSAPNTGGGSAGLYNPTTSTFFLKNTNSGGGANLTFSYGPAGAGWTPLAGDWDGNGSETIGLYNPSTSTFYLKNTNSAGAANMVVSFGPAGAGWKPLAGDWDGNGTDTIGLYNPSTSMFFLKNTNSAGAADLTFSYGPAGAGWTPLWGDWNGNGEDTVGLYNPSNSTFFLTNVHSGGAAGLVFSYGPAGAGWKPCAGDWNGDGMDSIGLYNPSTSTFFLKNSNTGGAANLTFSYGPAGAGWMPLMGNWDGL